MEESSLVALFAQDSCESCIVVHRGWSEEEWFYKHRNAGEDAWHSVDTLPAVAETVSEGGTFADECIYVWGIALVFSAFEVFVERPDIFAAKAFDNQNDDVFSSKARITR